MTFPETQTICDGMSISGHTVDEINAIVDLKKAWQWIFSNVKNKTDEMNEIKTINRIAGRYTVINAGLFRSTYDEPIRVPLRNGECYYPKLPDEKKIILELKKILENYQGLEQSLELFCYICKTQMFNDGNKRTATLYANMNMIRNCDGVLSIPVNYKLEFYNALTDYYADDANKGVLKKFLFEKCVTECMASNDAIM